MKSDVLMKGMVFFRIELTLVMAGFFSPDRGWKKIRLPKKIRLADWESVLL
jgi:hypothetical protein